MIEMLEEFVANARQYTERQVANYNEVNIVSMLFPKYALSYLIITKYY